MHLPNRLLILSSHSDKAQTLLECFPEFQFNELVLNNKYYEANIKVTFDCWTSDLDVDAVIYVIFSSVDLDHLLKRLHDKMETRLCLIHDSSLQEKTEDICLANGIEPILSTDKRVIEAIECHSWSFLKLKK
jgi:hypothetical protein